MKLTLWILTLSLLISANSFAQEDDYFEVEDPEEFIEPIPEPYYDEEPLEEYEMGGPPPPPPPPENFEPRPGSPTRPTFRGQQPSRPSTSQAASGEIEFRLMDPPKYYAGEKRPDIPKPKRKK